MKNVCGPFEGKRITVMGLGVLGRGVGDVEFLAKCGAHVLVTDKKIESELAESVEKLKKYPNVSYHLGGHEEKDFIDCDMVIKAAGVPLDSPEVAAARAAGIPVYMSTALFARSAIAEGAIIVGITGTRGKSTTTQMIYHSLVHANRRVHLGGNIRGISTLALLPEIEKGDIVVLELDSWQLQGFGDLQISPQIAVFSNLMPDHQNYYSNMDEYFEDKANIFRNQHQGDVLIIGKSVEDRVRKVKPSGEAHVTESIPEDWKLKIPGEHNRENAALAAEALRALKLSEGEVRAGLESFEGIEGRLQFLREIRGVKIFNDNNATTPDATIAGLRAVDPEDNKNIVLIMGGDDKKLDMSDLISEIPKHCSKVILFKERGTDRVRDEIFALKDQGIEVHEEEGLDNTVQRAFAVARSSEIILYSPAFSSFGKYFKNEFDRGDQFVSLIKALQ